MKVVKHNIIILFIFTGAILGSCTSFDRKSKYNIDQAPNINCCLVRDNNGKCYEEIVPGCSTDSAPLFKEQFFKPDSCCAYWGVDGMCYEELVKDCSLEYRY